jgi:hypothetical protein
MNRSYSKIRHIQESNQRLERRLISERVIREGGIIKQDGPIPNVGYFTKIQRVFLMLTMWEVFCIV